MPPVLDNLSDLTQVRSDHWPPSSHILEYLQRGEVKTTLIWAWCAIGCHGYIHRSQISEGFQQQVDPMPGFQTPHEPDHYGCTQVMPRAHRCSHLVSSGGEEQGI